MAALGIGLLFAVGSTWSAGLRAEGRAGNDPAGSNLPPQAVVQLEPDFMLRAPPEELRSSLAYSPRLIFSQRNRGETQLLHRGRAAMEWAQDGTRRVILEEQASYGRQDFSPLVSGAGVQPVDPHLATVSSVAYGSSLTALRYEDAVTRRAHLGAQAAYVVNGGIDDAARKLLPLQRGPQLSVQGRWAASRLDELNLELSGLQTSFSSGALASVFKAAAGLRSRLGAATTLECTAGASGASTSGGTVVQSGFRFLPLASASLATAVPLRRQRLGGSVTMQITPVVDSLTGDVYQRAESRAILDWSPLRSLSLSASGDGVHNLGGPFPSLGLAQSTVRATVVLDPLLALVVGVRASWFTGQFPGQAPFQWVGFIVASVTAAGAL